MVPIPHDIQTVRHISDDIAVMHRGKVIEFGPGAQVLGSPSQDYTRTLQAAAPSLLRANQVPSHSNHPIWHTENHDQNVLPRNHSAIVTPLNPDGTVNYDDLTNLVEHLIVSGVHGIFALGSTGQVAYISDDDRFAIVKSISKTVAGRVPVIAGAMDLSAQSVMRSANAMIDARADAIVTTAPLFAYDIPVRVHKKLFPKLLVELGKEGVIVGVKASSGDDVGFRRLIAMNRAAGSPLVLFTE